MEYRILGPLEVLDGDRTIDIGPKQQRSLLGLLLLSSNRVVSTSRILEELWGEDAHGKENTLWVYISRLRAALDPQRGPRTKGEVLVTKDHGYSLIVEDDNVDAYRFEVTVESGRALLRDDPSEASRILRSGLDMWRGTALQDFAYDDFAQTEITRLEELRLTAFEDRMEADFRAGRHREIAAELNAFTEANPYRERPVSLLMKALYRSGRQAEALRAFERHSRNVGTELGIEPSPELQRLEEQVLLHDPRLEGVRPKPASGADASEVPNPFKGLQAFSESDVPLFFGRDRLVSELIRRLNQDDQLLCLVGASGSGKSSVLSAGLIPAVRKGAITSHDHWLVAEMVPGSRPFTELEASLLRSRLDAPESLSELLEDGEDSILRACLRLLPDRTSRLLLVIDQFEELFTLVDSEQVRARFIANLETALSDPHGRIVVVLALRADFYQQPLSYPSFGERLGNGVVNTVPLTPDELELAAEGPAAFAGVDLEPSLLARLLSDVAGQSGGLPLFEYTLTQLYDRRVEGFMTAEAYKELGGVEGAISLRAEELYQELDETEKGAAKQLFLRLVTISESDAWTRRRVKASEIVSLGTDIVATQTVIEMFGTNRLLTFDRDAGSGSPTLEVAHEALLREWDRLRGWIDEGHEDVLTHARLHLAFEEWKGSGENPDYLLAGERLDHYEDWIRTSTLHLSAQEQQFVDTSLMHRGRQRLAEDERSARETLLDKQARQRLWWLAAALAGLVAVGVVYLVVSLAGEPPRIALVSGSTGDLGVNDLMHAGLADADREFEIQTEAVLPLVDVEEDLRQLAESGVELIIFGSAYDTFVEPVAADFPEVMFVGIDPFALHAPFENVAAMSFAVEEGAFLAGIAAAHETKTGVVGFIGAIPAPSTDAARVGFEQGVSRENAEVIVMSRYIGPVEFPFDTAPEHLNLARDLARDLYAEGADIVYHVAGAAGKGVLEAAVEMSTSERHLWVIGSDVDQYLTVSAVEQAHVLTSVEKRYDRAVSAAIVAFLDGSLSSGQTMLGLSDRGLELADSGGHLVGLEGSLANHEGEVRVGHFSVKDVASTSPTWQFPPDAIWRLTFGDQRCDVSVGPEVGADGYVSLPPGEIVLFEFTNKLNTVAGFGLRTVPFGLTVGQLAEEAKKGIPTSFEAVIGATWVAPGSTSSLAMAMPGAPVAPNCFVDSPESRPGDFVPMILQPSG